MANIIMLSEYELNRMRHLCLNQGQALGVFDCRALVREVDRLRVENAALRGHRGGPPAPSQSQPSPQEDEEGGT